MPHFGQTFSSASGVETRHFVLLLDDSGDSPLRPRDYRTPASDVAAALFRPIDGGPGFQSDRDILTIAFFQIPYEHEGRCFADRPLSSLTPEGMFDLVVPPKEAIAGEAVFTAFVEAQLHGQCRFPTHCFSPIQIALPLVVAAANRERLQEKQSPLVSKLYVLRASNDKVNPLGDENVLLLRDRDKGEALRRDVEDQIAFVQIDRIPGSDPALEIVRFRADAKLYPVSRPDAAVELAVSVVLHRTAIDGGRIRLDTAGHDVIRIVPTTRLTPIEVVLSTRDARDPNAPWKLGGHDLPREVRVPLTTCRRPCRRGADGALLVDVLSAVFPQRAIPAGSMSLSAGVIRARTHFSYGDGDISGGLLIDGPRTVFDFTPETDTVIPASFLYPRRTVMDNPTLAAEYRRSDREGIGQGIAVDRIEARRRYMLAAAVLLLVALAAASVYRRFTPAPFVTPNAVRVNLSSPLTPKYIDAALVEIRNTSQAWVRPLQWKRRGRWTLMIERVSAVWSTGSHVEGISTDALLRLQPIDRSVSAAERLDGTGEDRVVLLLDQKALADGSPPAGWNGERADLTINAALSMPPGQSRSVTLTVRLEPEEARQPKLRLDEIERDIQWDAERELDLGRVHFVSQAEHKFAKPARFSYIFSILRDGTSIYDSPPSTVMVASGAPVASAVVVPRGSTLNPATIIENWILKITPEHGGSVEVRMTVRRDIKTITPKIGIEAASYEPALLIWNEEGPIITVGPSVVNASGETLAFARSNAAVKVGGGGNLRVCTLNISHAVPELGGQFAATVRAALALGKERIDVPLKRAGGGPVDGVIRAGDVSTVYGDLPDETLHSIVQDHSLRQEEAMLTIQVAVVVPVGSDAKRRAALIEIPLLLVREERGAILSIDLGNSAIAIATLVSDGGFDNPEFVMTNCQTAVIRGRDSTLAMLDPGNAEKQSGLLPSAFCIEVDKRNDGGRVLDGKPGTHWSPPPPVFSGPDSRILSLPALTQHYSEYPQRIVRSIKHLLGSDYTKMILLDPILLGDESIGELEVDELLAAVFSAVAGTYANGLDFERIVHTVPNTFASWQLERAMNAIRNAFQKAIPEWIRPLRESDAVMYHYLDRSPDVASTAIRLFYDFGSGTIDLTLARITAHESGHEATILARIGLDRAGSHLDRLLAQCIHRKLEEATHGDQDIYRYPIIRGDGRRDPDRVAALANFRRRLSEAKHSWKSGQALKIDQGVERYALVRPDLWHVLTKAGIAEPDALLIGWDTIQGDAEIQAFLRFVRVELVRECLRLGNVGADDLDEIVLSGRGALWPDFHTVFRETFPNPAVTSIMGGGDDTAAMKTAVVRGAAAWMRNRSRLVVRETLPPPTYVAFSGLDLERGSWSKLVELKDDFAEIGTGWLDLARIDFRFSEKELSERMRHPLWRRLIRHYPGTRDCEPGTQAKVERSHDSRDVLVLRYLRTENRISPDDKEWSVGEWSFADDFGE